MNDYNKAIAIIEDYITKRGKFLELGCEVYTVDFCNEAIQETIKQQKRISELETRIKQLQLDADAAALEHGIVEAENKMLKEQQGGE